METLNYERLQKCENLYLYQLHEFDLYSGINFEGEFYPIPIRERTLIEDKKLIVPYADYVKGFERGYSLPLPANDDVIFSLIRNDYTGLKYFVSNGEVTRDSAKNFGLTVGKLYSAWEEIIRRIEDFAPFLERKQSQDTLTALTKDNHVVRLKMIYTYLKSEKYIDCSENDFLYWFGLKELPKKPDKIKWLGADSMLKNIIQQICDTSGKKYINTAFNFNDHYITTNYKKDYVGSDMFEKIKSFLYYAIPKI